MNKQFPASLDCLNDMLKFVHHEAKQIGFDESQINKIQLASEEALVNIISYGYPGHSGHIEIHCLSLKETGIKIIISDRGVPYNPLDNSAAFRNLKPHDAQQPGGYGIFFIRNIMDEVNYRRHNDQNELTLIKYL